MDKDPLACRWYLMKTNVCNHILAFDSTGLAIYTIIYTTFGLHIKVQETINLPYQIKINYIAFVDTALLCEQYPPCGANRRL